jgi:hypothetical protein
LLKLVKSSAAHVNYCSPRKRRWRTSTDASLDGKCKKERYKRDEITRKGKGKRKIERNMRKKY